MTMFGGSTVKFRSLKKLPRMSETTVTTFSEFICSEQMHTAIIIKWLILMHCSFNTVKEGSTWVLVGVANSRQIGTSDRIRERMLKISESCC